MGDRKHHNPPAQEPPGRKHHGDPLEAKVAEEPKAGMGGPPDPTAQADGDDGDPKTGGMSPTTGERMGHGKTHRGPTGMGQMPDAPTAEGGERSARSGRPGRK